MPPHVYLGTYPQVPGREGRVFEHQAGLALLSKGLKDLAGVDFSPSELEQVLIKEEKGKPALMQPDLPFNISNSHGLACCAFSEESIGVDVEYVRPEDPRDSLLRKVLSQTEQVLFDFLPPSAASVVSASSLLFLRYWTLKEAYGKQTGVGIGYPMQELSFHLPDSPLTPGNMIEIPSPVPGLYFYQTLLQNMAPPYVRQDVGHPERSLPGTYVLSLCCERHYAAEDISLHFVP